MGIALREVRPTPSGLPHVNGTSGTATPVGIPTWASDDEVHVWSTPIGPAVEAADLELLDDDEAARADRFRFEHDRAGFVRRRAFVRRTLAPYVASSPESLRFTTTRSGRPVLRGRRSPRFSVSHSGALAVVAVSRRRRVGVDIEALKPIEDPLALARSLFAPVESARLSDAPGDRIDELFLTLWTRKESYVKALGGGLRIPLDGFVVAATESDRTGHIEDRRSRRSFTFEGLDTPSGYVGTVVLAGPRLDPSYREASATVSRTTVS